MGAVEGIVTVAVFEAQMDRLMGLKFPPSSLTTHWEALKDLPEPLLAAAVEKAQQEVHEFPSPKMLKSFADQLRPRVLGLPQEVDRSVPLRAPREITIPEVGKVIPITRDWNYYCDDCSDQGWRSFWCGEKPSARYPWLPVQTCGRRQEHGDHEWTDPCPCASHNPDVQRRKERQRQAGKRGDTN